MRKVEQSFFFFFLKKKAMSSFLQKAKKVDHLAPQPSVEGRIQKRKICCKENVFDAFWAKICKRLLKDRERKQGGE